MRLLTNWLWLLIGLGYATGYNYLMVLPTAAKSHYYVGAALAKGLAAAGHQVTVISPFPQQKPIKNIMDVATPNVLQVMSVHLANLLTNVHLPMVRRLPKIHNMGLEVTEALLQEPAVQQLLLQNQTYDAVICEVFMNEAQFGFAAHFQAPLIALSSFGASAWTNHLVGTPSPPSYVPHNMLQFSDRMTFMQRAHNLLYTAYEYLFLEWFYLPRQEQLYRKYFPKNKQDFYDVRRSTALVLLNQHVSLSSPRPYAPNMIEVGGMHINHEAKELPDDIARFINEAAHGVIYFSMGSNLKSKDLPAEKRQILIDTFRGIKQRVLWKFEQPNLANKPDNVYISDWFPQHDILAHKNVIAFITHGGLLSTTESIYHGKPVLGMPVFGDQFLNMARAEQFGYGITVKYMQLSQEKFSDAVERIVSDHSYTEQAQAMSERFRDQPEKPLRRAIYWVEHVTRQKGAKYLRSSALDLNLVKYYNLDVLGMLVFGIAFILFALIVVLRLLYTYVTGKLQKKQEKKKKVKRN